MGDRDMREKETPPVPALQTAIFASIFFIPPFRSPPKSSKHAFWLFKKQRCSWQEGEENGQSHPKFRGYEMGFEVVQQKMELYVNPYEWPKNTNG